MREQEKHEAPILAIDIGGTKVIIVIISADGRLIAEERYPTLAYEGPQAVIDRLFSNINHILVPNNMEPSQLGGISIAAAGAIDSDKGMITFSPNLPGWTDISLRDMVQEKYRVGAFLVNDASAAALGEYQFGVGRGTNNLILLTLGTGIGGGIVINGELYTGSSGSAGEIGHMTIDVNGHRCACGNIGCLEALASGTAVAREAIKRVRQGERSSLVDMVGGKVEDITAEIVGDAAKKGDSLSLAIISEAGTYLGIGMANLVNIFNPDMIVAGGGMAKLGDLLLGPARQVVQERAFPISARAVQIVAAQLGDEAGVYGAAAFALKKKKLEGSK